MLNMKAYRQLFDEDIEWLMKQKRTLEREHIRDCLEWMRDHKHQIDMEEAERVIAQQEKDLCLLNGMRESLLRDKAKLLTRLKALEEDT